MAARWRTIIEQLGRIWGSLPKAARLAIPGVVGLVFLALLVLPRLLSPPFEPLFTGLSVEEAAQIVSFLQGKKVPYRLAAGGTAILVPADQVYELRLEVAGAGLPGDSVVGFELLNQTNLGLTDFERRARYNWALQGELTRTIEKMEGVEEARVHLVIPEPSVFVREKEPPSASVFVRLRPGRTLSPVQVRAITTLVSRSVAGLKEKDVAVVDQDGRLLTAGLDSETAGVAGGGLSTAAASERLALTREFERHVEERVRSMLEQVFGLGQAVVRASATLDFDVREERQEQYAPLPGSDRGVLRSEQVESESSSSTNEPGAAGVPGVSSNIPGYAALAAEALPSATGDRSLAIRNYEVNRTESYYAPAPGQIRRLSVAVVLNQTLAPQLRAQVEQAVASAAGIDPDRGDQLTIATVPFSTGAEPGVETQAPPARRWGTLETMALLLLAGILFFVAGLLFAWRRARRRALEPGEAFSEALAQARATGETGGPAPGVPAGTAAATPAEEARVPAGVVPGIDLLVDTGIALDEQELRRRQLQEQVARLAREDPEGFLRTLRNWLVDEGTARGRGRQGSMR
ncbi:MAG TPA: flagellar M-ring protein FliF [Firmicutes bacterium]|nr:flagellar M-ring protein FliF [Bacillota bacterium]